jgi:hypothetical protein
MTRRTDDPPRDAGRMAPGDTPATGPGPKGTEGPAADPSAACPKSLSMHEGVEVWEDCCSCEAEPYWLAAFEDSDD